MIVCTDITKTYASGQIQTFALKKISCAIEEGEFVAIMGPSGSGKSTFMHILGCLDTPSAGTYRLDGQDVSRLTDDALARIRNQKIGFVFQSFNLLPRATVLRNVMLPLIYAAPVRSRTSLRAGADNDTRESRAAAALKAAAFPESFWSHRPNQLSGGMMQRVAIARSLVNNPSLILADEPTGNLDTKTGEAVLAAFQRLHTEQGRTIVLITHEPYVAEHAGRIIHLRDGEIINDEKNHNRRIVPLLK